MEIYDQMRTTKTRAVGNASRGAGSVGHPAARASVCSAPRTSLNMESEIFVVRRKEGPQEARASLRSASRAQFVAWPGLARLQPSGSVVGLSGPDASTGSVEPAGGFWTARVVERECMPREAVGE
jgi:hypothetical protein